MDAWQREYQRLLRALKASMDREKTMMSTLRELKEVLQERTTKLEAAMALKEEDEQTIRETRADAQKGCVWEDWKRSTGWVGGSLRGENSKVG